MVPPQRRALSSKLENSSFKMVDTWTPFILGFFSFGPQSRVCSLSDEIPGRKDSKHCGKRRKTLTVL